MSQSTTTYGKTFYFRLLGLGILGILSIGFVIQSYLGVKVFPPISDLLTGEPSRSQLIQLLDRIQIGDSKEIVRTKSRLVDGTHVSLPPDDEPNVWRIDTPLQFGGRNWYALLEFENNQVVAIKVRCPDENQIPPQGAPTDRSATRGTGGA